MSVNAIFWIAQLLRYRWARRRTVEHALRRFISKRRAVRIARLIP